MAGRRLSTDEQALWARVTAGVLPLGGRRGPLAVAPVAGPRAIAADDSATKPDRPRPVARPRPIAEETLDGGWDRRLRRGDVEPDCVVDLHGHTLATAHATLERALHRALTRDLRLILLVTGRPPRREPDGRVSRGLIRASILDWLAGSSHGARIAAVRGAHPRHGGAGALYVVLRRPRAGRGA